MSAFSRIIEIRQQERRAAFIRALAEYLVGNEAEMSIKLQMNKPEAVAWAALRNASPLRGWLTVEEAEQQLMSFMAPK